MSRRVLLAYATPRVAYDGIHDYCVSVAAALNEVQPHLASVVLRERPRQWRLQGDSDPGPLPASVPGTRAPLVALQYNPFSYARGLAPGLVGEVARLRRSSTRVALVVHEPYVNTGSLGMRLLGHGQHAQLRALIRVSDDVLITTERWRQLLPMRFPARALLAVAGSNLPDGRSTREGARERLGLTEGALACVTVGLTRPHQLAGHVRAALHAVHEVTRDVLHLNLGRNATPAPVAGVRSMIPGPRPAVELAALVAAGDVFLAPYADGATTRRTGLAAALQHGLATVATAPEDRSAPWEHGGVKLTTDVPSFARAAAQLAADPALRQRSGREARAVYERLFDWQIAVEPYRRLAG